MRINSGDTTAVRLFYSYSHRDEELREHLEDHLALLRRDGVIEEWHDRKIIAGSEWAQEIDSNLNSADVILLLVSASFVASDYCFDMEMSRAMERHNGGEACVIPVILRPVDNWQSAPFGKLQACPKGGKPITKWDDRDEAFSDVAQCIRNAVKELTTRRHEVADDGATASSAPDEVRDFSEAKSRILDDNQSEDSRKEAINELAQIRHVDAIAVLLDLLLANDIPTDLRYWVGGQLIEHYSSKTHEAVFPTLMQVVNGEREGALDLVLAMLYSLPDERMEGTADTFVRLYAEHREEHPARNTIRRIIADRLGKRAKDAAPLLVEDIAHDDLEIRCEVAYALGKIGPAAAVAIPGLIDNLRLISSQDQGSCFSIYTISALGGIGSAAFNAVPAIVEVLHDKSATWVSKQCAAEALGEIGSGEAVLALSRVFKDEPSDEESIGVHIAAAKALEKLGSEADGAIPQLSAALESALCETSLEQLMANARVEQWGLENTQYGDQLRIVLVLIEDSPDMAIVKCRTILDEVLHSIACTVCGRFSTDESLETLITKLSHDEHIPRRIEVLARIVTSLGKTAAHAILDTEGISQADAHVAFSGLLLVLEWYKRCVLRQEKLPESRTTGRSTGPDLSATEFTRLGQSHVGRDRKAKSVQSDKDRILAGIGGDDTQTVPLLAQVVVCALNEIRGQWHSDVLRKGLIEEAVAGIELEDYSVAADVKSVLNLMKKNPDLALVKCRMIVEKMLCSVSETAELGGSSNDVDSLTTELAEAGCMPRKVEVLAKVISELGNVAERPIRDDELFTHREAHLSLSALVILLKWFCRWREEELGEENFQ